MTIIPQCFACRRFHFGSGADGSPMTCEAYPETGIPEAILLARHDHRTPFPGDHGLRFEPGQPQPKPKGS
jgi:hypothetical protein